MAGRGRPAMKISATARVRSVPAWLMLAGVLWPAGAVGQTVDRRSLHGYRVRHMMPAATMLSAAQTADGYLWFGTLKGLARYDGHHFFFFDTDNSPLPSDEIGAVLADGQDTLWIGTLTAGLVRKQGPAFRVFTTADGLCGNEIRGLAWFRGALWVGTDQGVCRRRGETWLRNDPPAVGVDAPVVNTLLSGADDRLWLGSTQGWFSFDGQRWAAADTALPELVAQARALKTTRAITDSRGASWLVTGRTLRRVAPGGELTTWAAVDLVGAYHLTNVFEDREHNVWVTSHVGVAQLSPSPVRVVRAEHARASRPPFAMEEGVDGRLWLSSGTELQREEGGEIRLLGDLENMPDYSLRKLLVTARDGVWITTLNPRLVVWRDERFSTVDLEPGVAAGDRPVALAQTADRAIWIGTTHGRILRIEVAHPSARPVPLEQVRLPPFEWNHRLPLASEEDVPGAVRLLVPDGDGFWIGTQENGLWRWAGGRARPVRVSGVPANLTVTSHLRDPVDGAAWFSSSDGLLRVAASGVAQVRRSHGLKDADLVRVVDDGLGCFWLATKRGVFRVARDELAAVADGRAPTVKTTAYGIEDGLPSERVMAGLRRRNGQLWFSTTAGLGVIDPRGLQDSTPLPPVVFEATLFDGQARATPGTGGQALQVPPGRGSVEVHYTLPTFRFNHRLRFEYRLRGWDDRWMDAGDRRLAQFTNLAPGAYTFEARAHEDGHPRQSPVAGLAFALLPRFHQTRWFLCLMAVAVLALAYLVQFLRVRQVRLRHQAVIEERNRIARDLHDTVAQVFSAIGFQLGTLRRAIQTGKQDLEGRFKEIFRTVGNARIVSRSVIQNLRGEGQPLVTALEELGKVYDGVPIVVSIEGEARRMSAQLESELLRIAQESVNNSIQHGAATEITIELAFGPPLELAVRDNGRGFSAARSGGDDAGHFGLLGMQERARGLGGRLEVHTEPGVGTEVSIVMESKQ